MIHCMLFKKSLSGYLPLDNIIFRISLFLVADSKNDQLCSCKFLTDFQSKVCT